jgi:hypothetical protein
MHEGRRFLIGGKSAPVIDGAVSLDNSIARLC